MRMVALDALNQIADKAGDDAAILFARLCAASDERGIVDVKAREFGSKLGVSEATIYRRLTRLEEARIITHLGFSGRSARYALAENASQSLLCKTGCGVTIRAATSAAR